MFSVQSERANRKCLSTSLYGTSLINYDQSISWVCVHCDLCSFLGAIIPCDCVECVSVTLAGSHSLVHLHTHSIKQSKLCATTFCATQKHKKTKSDKLVQNAGCILAKNMSRKEYPYIMKHIHIHIHTFIFASMLIQMDTSACEDIHAKLIRSTTLKNIVHSIKICSSSFGYYCSCCCCVKLVSIVYD